MFNFNHDQNAANPNPNNYCGGYSLAAIATRLQPMGNHNPQTVYNILRGSQVGLGQNSRDLVAGTQRGGTDMLLPSTFLAAQYAHLNYELYLNSDVFLQELEVPEGISANNVLDEEIATINTLPGAHLHLLSNQMDNIDPSLEDVLRDDFDNNQHRYWLVLVLEGRHWVAIERDPNGYCIYNPAGGINDSVIIADDLISYNNVVHNEENWSGIAISVA